MSEELKTVVEQINRSFAEFREVNDKSLDEAKKRYEGATAETSEKLDKINTHITELRKQQNELEKQVKRPDFGMQGGSKKDPEEELREQIYLKYVRYGVGNDSKVAYLPEELRALSGQKDTDGQFLVPQAWESGIIMMAYDAAEIRGLCNVGTTSRDVVKFGALEKPTVEWGSRGIAITAQDLTTGGRTLNIRNLRALSLFSNDTLEDADADILAELQMKFAPALAEAEDDAFIVGSDVNGPPGIMSHPDVLDNYKYSGVADAIYDGTHNGADAILDVLYALPKQYRRNGTFACNSQTESVIRKLKDGSGVYLWEPSLQAGVPATLTGRPIVNPEGMADIAANSYPLVFGDFRSGYAVRDRPGLTIQRIVERYVEYDQTGLMIKKRVGGQVLLPEAFIPLKIATS